MCVCVCVVLPVSAYVCEGFLSTVLGSLVLPVQCFTAAALCSCFALLANQARARLSGSHPLWIFTRATNSAHAVSEARASRLLYNSVEQLDDNGVRGDQSLENGERSAHGVASHRARAWLRRTERQRTAGDGI